MGGLTDGDSLDGLLAFLRESRGFDADGLDTATIAGRVRTRLSSLDLAGFDAYRDHLEVHPEEYTGLFDSILDRNSAFFDDPAAWEHLRRDVIPLVADARRADGHIRVWSAGCGSGQEAYALAALFAECLGTEELHRRVKLYATEADEDALGRARAGVYALDDLASVPEELRAEFFETDGRHTSVRPLLRRSVIFGRHDLAENSPIGRLDLAVCRNKLMYLDAERQARVLGRLHGALNDGGFLWLGPTETASTSAALFTQSDGGRKFYRKLPYTAHADDGPVAPAGDGGRQVDHHGRIRDAAFRVTPEAHLVVDRAGVLVLANEEAASLLGVGRGDVGRRLRDLEISYRPVDLRSHIDEAQTGQAPVHIPGVRRVLPGDRIQHLDVVVTPLSDEEGDPLGCAVSFTDLTTSHELEAGLERSRQELETAYEELQSMTEELETTNEELQSTVEELETTNEELQSANEELETMNEELESGNSELQSINTQMRGRSQELDRVNAFMESVLTSVRVGLVVVDAGLRVTAWNGRSPDLWGLRAAEVVGRPFLTLDIGLPVEELAAPVRRSLTGDSPYSETVVTALTRRGRTISCRVTCTPLLGPSGARDGAVIVVEEVSPPN